MSTERIHIIGVGDDGWEGLTGQARRLIEQAELILGPADQLERLGKTKASQVDCGLGLDELIGKLDHAPDVSIIVLTSGDPLFYGTARFLCDRFGKDRIAVLPHVSSLQLPFARVKESWEEAYLTNLANQSLDRIIERIRTAEKVGIFTTEKISPSTVAKPLVSRRIDYFHAYVCENLGSPDERVTHADLAELVDQRFSPLNVMILVRKPAVPDRPISEAGKRLFGNPDEWFVQTQPKRGLLTPSEVRSMALAELDLAPASVVWDVGAGSGSVSIEAAQIAHDGKVYSIEMDVEDFELLRINADRFGVQNLVPVLGKAPEAWESLEAPDAIFVGGTGRQVAKIVEMALPRLRPRGRLVAHVSSLDNAHDVWKAMNSLPGNAQVWMLNLARGIDQLDHLTFEPLMPTFLLRWHDSHD
ncbi:MAG: precorrin-6y C5,15-methyltransferase (decarboxylating) subunit CbiE [Pirellulaceae bacterium]